MSRSLEEIAEQVGEWVNRPDAYRLTEVSHPISDMHRFARGQIPLDCKLCDAPLCTDHRACLTMQVADGSWRWLDLCPRCHQRLLAAIQRT